MGVQNAVVFADCSWKQQYNSRHRDREGSPGPGQPDFGQLPDGHPVEPPENTCANDNQRRDLAVSGVVHVCQASRILSRSNRRRILPEADLGISLTKWT